MKTKYHPDTLDINENEPLCFAFTRKHKDEHENDATEIPENIPGVPSNKNDTADVATLVVDNVAEDNITDHTVESLSTKNDSPSEESDDDSTLITHCRVTKNSAVPTVSIRSGTNVNEHPSCEDPEGAANPNIIEISNVSGHVISDTMETVSNEALKIASLPEKLNCTTVKLEKVEHIKVENKNTERSALNDINYP